MKIEDKELKQRIHDDIMNLIEEANRREGNVYHMYRKPVWKHKSWFMTVICYIAYQAGIIVSRIRSVF